MAIIRMIDLDQFEKSLSHFGGGHVHLSEATKRELEGSTAHCDNFIKNLSDSKASIEMEATAPTTILDLEASLASLDVEDVMNQLNRNEPLHAKNSMKNIHTKADSNIDYTNLEDCVRETMDASSPRAFGILKPLKVTILNWDQGVEEFNIERHLKLDLGKRAIPFDQTLFIERTDFFDADGPEGKKSGGQAPKGFKRLLPGGKVRLRYAYVVECTKS